MSKLDSSGEIAENSVVLIYGRAHKGDVILDGECPLPESAAVAIVYPSALPKDAPKIAPPDARGARGGRTSRKSSADSNCTILP
jgi:hypothetical protein